eukprot:1339844-Rhodomonas_salina.2
MSSKRLCQRQSEHPSADARQRCTCRPRDRGVGSGGPSEGMEAVHALSRRLLCRPFRDARAGSIDPAADCTLPDTPTSP